MSFPRYPEYKESGVEWLGEVPVHWQVARFKHVFAERNSRSVHGEEELLSVSAYSGVRPRADSRSEGEHLSRSESLEGYKKCESGDLVMNIMLAWNRGLGFSWMDGIVSPAYSVFSVINDSSKKFLDYLVRSDEYTRYFKAFSSGVIDSRLRLYPEVFGRLFCVLPPYDEQTKIAGLLDHETGKIDALIAEQQRLIELLKEKRQAAISHAVTKGLDPNVPMKDSGVEWLGEVPAHWEVKKVSYLFRARKGEKGALLTKAYCDEHAGSFPVYSGQTENQGILGYLDWYELDLAEDGGILATTVGANAMSLSFVSGRLSLSQNCMVIMPVSPEAFARFYFYHFQPLFKRERNMIPDHMQPSFRMDDLYSFYIALPPATEQREIASYLDATSGPTEGLLQSATRAIELLRERRSALISAAVTGKIDVRGWSAGAKSEEPELAMVAEEPAGYSAQGGSA